MSTKKLQIIGTIGNGGLDGSIGTADDVKAVSYDIEQNLTEDQKHQARKNIGVEDVVMDILVALDLVPAILDGDGAILMESSGAVLMNM